MYYRRRKIYNLHYHRNTEAWSSVGLLLDALGTLGTSDDETDDDSEHRNPDSRFKTVRRVDMGFLNPAIAQIWASVGSYPSALCPSHGNRAFKRISKANQLTRIVRHCQGCQLISMILNGSVQVPLAFRGAQRQRFLFLSWWAIMHP